MDKKSRLFELVVIFICYGVFLKDTAPTIFPGDSPEIITGTLVMGVIHGLSFPFAVVFGNLFQHLPLGGLAWRVNLFSVFCGVFSVFLLLKITLSLQTRAYNEQIQRQLRVLFLEKTPPPITPTKTLVGRRQKKVLQKNVKRANQRGQNSWQSQLARLWPVLLILGGTAFKYQVIRAEVYVQFTTLFLVLVWLVVQTDSFEKTWPLMLLILGLSVGVHLYLGLALLLAPPMLFFLSPRLRTLKTALSSLIILIIACSVYLYLPIRAVQTPAINFDDPATLGSIRDSFFRFNQIIYVNIDLAERIKKMFLLFLNQMSFPGLALAIWGLAVCCRENWRAGLVICLILAVNILSYIKHVDFSPTHLDTLGFLLLSVNVLVLLVGYALYHLAGFLENRGTVLKYVFLGLVTLFFVSRAAANWSVGGGKGERNNRIAYNFAVDTVNSVGQGHLVMKGNTLTFPLAFLVHIEGRGRRIKYYNPFDGGIFTLIKHPGRSAGVEVERKRRMLINQLLREKRPLYSGMMLFGFNYYNLGLDWEIAGLAYRLQEGEPVRKIPTRCFHWPINEKLPFDNKSRRIRAIYLFRRGETAFAADRPDAGTRLWRDASEAAHDDAVFLADLGAYFLEKRMIDPGILLIERGLALNPAVKGGYTNLAQAYYYGKGDKNTALRYVKKALAINPQDIGASQLLKELKRIRVK